MEVKIFTDALLEAVSLLNGQSVGFRYHRYYIYIPMEVLHELHINRTEATEREGGRGGREGGMGGREGGRERKGRRSQKYTTLQPTSSPMASWRDEVEAAVDSCIRDYLLPINAHLLVEIAVKLLVNVLSNWLPTLVVVDLIPKPWGVCYG